MTFHLFARFLGYKEKTTKDPNTGYIVKYISMRVRDQTTKLVWALFDYSHKARNVKIMESKQDHTLSLCGFVNRTSAGTYYVLDKWAIWDEIERQPRHPVTNTCGYLQVDTKPKGNKNDEV